MSNEQTPAPQDQQAEAVEIAAWAMWKEEAAEGTPKSIYHARTIEAFRSDLNPEDQERWLRKGRAVFAALASAPQAEASPSRDKALRADQVAICSPSCTFAEAFAASREARYGQFEWRGKLYHTRTESEDRQFSKTPVIVGSRAALEDRT